MGSGTEIIFIAGLGVLILGPKRLHTLLGQVGKAKARFEEVKRGINSQLEAELQTAPPLGNRDNSRQSDGA